MDMTEHETSGSPSVNWVDGRPYSGWGALRPRGFWQWLGALVAVVFGIAWPVLGLLLLASALYIVFRDAPSPEVEQERMQAKLEEKRVGLLRWCPNCKQNIRPVRPSPTAGSLLAAGGVGYALRDQRSCPICRTESLEEAHRD